MINASFNSGKTRATAISGAYQYDTGQRLVMHGLPSPEEFSGEDDFLSGGCGGTLQPGRRQSGGDASGHLGH